MENTTLNANSAIYEAIKQIAFHKMVNPKNNVIYNTEKILGYVSKIHTEGDLCGTVDVQEYICDLNAYQAQEKGVPVGLHQGVYLSAIQNNENGMFVIPFLYSDVVITTDPETLREYVIQYSHADTIKFDAHNKVVIGTTETKEWEADENSPDVDELEKTGVHSHTTYIPTSILSEVAKGTGSNEKSTIEITADNISAIHDKSQLVIDAQKLLAKYNAKEIVIKDDGVYLGKGNASEPGVLGDQLATLLVDWLGTLSQMMTPTMMGPQPPANLAKFVSLQAKVQSYQSSISGFLSKTVKVAE